jgi:hypothetical protein
MYAMTKSWSQTFAGAAVGGGLGILAGGDGLGWFGNKKSGRSTSSEAVR